MELSQLFQNVRRRTARPAGRPRDRPKEDSCAADQVHEAGQGHQTRTPPWPRRPASPVVLCWRTAGDLNPYQQCGHGTCDGCAPRQGLVRRRGWYTPQPCVQLNNARRISQPAGPSLQRTPAYRRDDDHGGLSGPDRFPTSRANHEPRPTKFMFLFGNHCVSVTTACYPT
jgi:hypothetical protein